MWEEAAGVGADVIVGVGVKAPSDAKHCDAVFNELMQECKHSAPGARLSARLRTALERMRPERRRGVVSRVRDGCAPLFVASRRGNVELVEYLVHVCDADLEQRGVYEVPHDRSTHTVTPLWCAAVAGRLGVLRALADAGAQLDASSDSGSTPVRSACFMTHVDVVRELLARGADLHRPNHTGGTCLINAVQSVPLCALLLAHGARVDAQDLQRKTALHYAAQEHRLDTARLLLDHGADASLRSRAGDDALRTAALKGAAQVVALLLAREPADAARAADALELLGATQLDEFNDAAAALQAWRRATALRAAHRAAKTGHVEAARALADAALGGAREWQTLAELAALAGDADALRTQALLVAARVLGAQHKDTVFRLMYRGAAHADAFRYQRCIELWSWALRVRIERDTLLYADTCHTASALTRLLLDAGGGRLERAGDLPRHADVLRVFTLLADHLPECRAALVPRPVHKKQAETFDRALRCVTHLLHLLLQTAPDDEASRERVTTQVARLVAADVRSAHTGDSLLHLCASRLNVVRSTYFADELGAPPVFPSARVVRLLLRAGADARARNEARSTPLHVAAIPYNFSTELVSVLLAGGAHLDQPNKFGDSAAELVPLNRGSRVCVLRHVSLACLAARAVLASRRAVPADALPATLHAFLDLHRA
ncbi:protein fem-1 homolog C isoform X1 [Maniola jurtina]|uniref:protein fem-1 homolog C isoform X1 n=1 Tax=Maniola jurtina TaxID=191418 RepID=UPI001E688727|nr:protein fem-1 homolog C isoform X1 [Maniola jurtina]